jgi:GTP pyrophosphokinase
MIIKHERSQELIDYAIQLATEWHEGQVRKYTFEPYITHPLAVAAKVAQHTNDCQIICGAILHDVVEDCGVSRDTLLNAENYY